MRRDSSLVPRGGKMRDPGNEVVATYVRRDTYFYLLPIKTISSIYLVNLTNTSCNSLCTSRDGCNISISINMSALLMLMLIRMFREDMVGISIKCSLIDLSLILTLMPICSHWTQ